MWTYSVNTKDIVGLGYIWGSFQYLVKATSCVYLVKSRGSEIHGVNCRIALKFCRYPGSSNNETTVIFQNDRTILNTNMTTVTLWGILPMSHSIHGHLDFRTVFVISVSRMSLEWRHNGRDSVSNHQPHDGLLNRSFRRRSKKTSKLRVTGLCAGNSPVPGEFPAQMASNAENVSIWWRHHDHSNWYQKFQNNTNIHAAFI